MFVFIGLILAKKEAKKYAHIFEKMSYIFASGRSSKCYQLMPAVVERRYW